MMAAKRTKGNTRASRQRILAAERHIRAIELRKAGVTFQQIADQLGYANAAGAHKAVTTALREMLREPTEELRALEVARLDHMLFGIWRKAISGGTWEIDRALKIMERRSMLLGLDAPKRIENTGKDGGAIAFSMEGVPDFSRLTPRQQFDFDQMLAQMLDPEVQAVVTEDVEG